jgi:putative ribosome biogenesis GTPase RsgA
MIFLSGGDIVIDTPGIRELQLLTHEQGAEQAFRTDCSVFTSE